MAYHFDSSYEEALNETTDEEPKEEPDEGPNQAVATPEEQAAVTQPCAHARKHRTQCYKKHGLCPQENIVNFRVAEDSAQDSKM